LGEEEQRERRSPGEIALRRRMSSDEGTQNIEKLLKEIHRVNCALFTLLSNALSDKVDAAISDKLKAIIAQSIKKID